MINKSNFDITDTVVTFRDKDGEIILSEKQAVTTGNGSFEIRERSLDAPRSLCVEGTIGALNSSYFEYRQFGSEQFRPNILERVFSAERPPSC